MKTENFKEIQERLIALMETEGANWTQRWVGASKPTNFSTKKAYRGLNNFWLSMQEFESSEWGTWKQWTEADHEIQEDQRKEYTFIYFSQLKKKNESWLNEKELVKFRATGELPTYWMWRRYNVYNAQQVTDYQGPVISNTPKTELTKTEADIVDEYIKSTEADITHQEFGGQAFYKPSIDSITMPAKKAFFSDVDYYSTLTHELTHWTGHKSRCNRKLSSQQEAYAKEELVAEIGSAMLCSELRIEKSVREDHAQYLNGWITAIRDSERAMVSAFSLAQKALDHIESLQVKHREAA